MKILKTFPLTRSRKAEDWQLLFFWGKIHSSFGHWFLVMDSWFAKCQLLLPSDVRQLWECSLQFFSLFAPCFWNLEKSGTWLSIRTAVVQSECRFDASKSTPWRRFHSHFLIKRKKKKRKEKIEMMGRAKRWLCAQIRGPDARPAMAVLGLLLWPCASTQWQHFAPSLVGLFGW